MDRVQLADFLRRRRDALQPEDVGLSNGPRRRTAGLRREEVALLASMSTDYYSRLEQQRGPQPSEMMLSSIARALRLTQDERDHLFRLAGHTAPPSMHRLDHVSPALMRVLDRLDTPAQVVSDLGETLAQNAFAIALLGDQTAYSGFARSIFFRWFTDPAERDRYHGDDHGEHARTFVGGLRAAYARHREDPYVEELIAQLREVSAEFACLWQQHEVGKPSTRRKRLVHPEVGTIVVDCQTLVSDNQTQALLVYTAIPGSEDRDKLTLVGVIGQQRFGGEQKHALESP